MGNILLPKIAGINPALRTELLKKVDCIIRGDEDIEKALDLVDREVLVNLLGVDPAICNQSRTIWKKMQRRRLGRG